MKPVNGRFGNAVPDLPHATQRSKAARETRKWMSWMSSNILLIMSHGSIDLVGPNPRAASGFTHVYSVWLKCQVRERLTVLSTDIGTGFQIFRRRARRFCSTLKVARLDPHREKSHSGLAKAIRGMNFSAVELNALIHDSKQQLWQIRRMDRSRMRANDHSLHSNSETNRTIKKQITSRILILNPENGFKVKSPQFLCN
jgi:hypothetical protein